MADTKVGDSEALAKELKKSSKKGETEEKKKEPEEKKKEAEEKKKETADEKAEFEEFRRKKISAPFEKQISELQKQLESAIKNTNSPSALSSWISTYLYQLFLYLPNALILFGPIIDTINQEFRYTLASLIGVFSVILNSLIGKIVSKFVEASHLINIKQGCSVPGFEFLESPFSPQGIVLPATMFTYLLIDLGIHRSPSENFGTAALMFTFIIIQSFVMNANDCFKYYYFTNKFITILLALLVGLFCGLMGWIGVRFGAPQRLPTGGSVFSPTSTAGLTKSVLSVGVKNDVATCSPPNDQDQFVCEAYKDGEVVTSTIVN